MARECKWSDVGVCVAEWLRCSDGVKMWVVKCWNMCSRVVKMACECKWTHVGVCVAEWLRCSDSVKMWVVRCWSMCRRVVKMLR